MAQDGSRWVNGAGFPLIATVARLLCRELTLQNEYLRLESRILRSKVTGRLRFTDEERRSGVAAALAMGRKLMRHVVGIVKPDRLLAWQRRLAKREWDYSPRRQQGPGRPRTPGEVEALVCRLANRVPQAVRTGASAAEHVRGPIGTVHCEEGLGGLLKVLSPSGETPVSWGHASGPFGAGTVQWPCASAGPTPSTDTFSARRRRKAATHRQGKQPPNSVGRVPGHYALSSG